MSRRRRKREWGHKWTKVTRSIARAKRETLPLLRRIFEDHRPGCLCERCIDFRIRVKRGEATDAPPF